MAAKASLTIVPHNTQTGAASVNILQFASCTPNIGPQMEYPWRASQRPASWYSPNFTITDGSIPVPDGPGMVSRSILYYVAHMEVVAKVG